MLCLQINRPQKLNALTSDIYRQLTQALVAAKPATALVETKRLLKAGYQQALAQTLSCEAEIFARQLQSQEAIKALGQLVAVTPA